MIKRNYIWPFVVLLYVIALIMCYQIFMVKFSPSWWILYELDMFLLILTVILASSINLMLKRPYPERDEDLKKILILIIIPLIIVELLVTYYGKTLF